jgi:DNA mismatch endonuclease (patch repair protein)
MRRQRRRDTRPEIALRRELHHLGVRYRVDEAPLRDSRTRADVVFRPASVAVYVQGCFWHGCPEHMTWPSANADWWRDKIEANVARDRDTDRRLADAGWLPIRIWEHEDPKLAAARVAEIVRSRRARTTT